MIAILFLAVTIMEEIVAISVIELNNLYFSCPAVDIHLSEEGSVLLVHGGKPQCLMNSCHRGILDTVRL